MNKTADIKMQLLAIMNENLSAMIRAKKGKMKGVLKNNDPFDCVIETYQDLISIINNLPLKGTVPQSMADRINDTAGVNAGMKWVKASERLPETEEDEALEVIINSHVEKANEKDVVLSGVFYNGRFYVGTEWISEYPDEVAPIEYGMISHWMELPLPPTESPSPTPAPQEGKDEKHLK